jgi:hypothetical protein
MISVATGDLPEAERAALEKEL